MFEVDYEKIIDEKFPNCDVEVLTEDIFELDKLLEYITDDIVIYNPAGGITGTGSQMC